MSGYRGRCFLWMLEADCEWLASELPHEASIAEVLSLLMSFESVAADFKTPKPLQKKRLLPKPVGTRSSCPAQACGAASAQIANQLLRDFPEDGNIAPSLGLDERLNSLSSGHFLFEAMDLQRFVQPET